MDFQEHTASLTFNTPRSVALRELVQSVLNGCGDAEVKRLRVSCDTVEIYLDGLVTSSHRKQIAQALALTVKGVDCVHNRVRVAKCPSPVDIAD